MRLLILTFLFNLTTVFAAENNAIMLICPINYARTYKTEVDRMLVSDKQKHCTMSCFIKLHCSSYSTYQLGVIKEIADFFLPNHNSELKDIKANLAGIYIAKQVQSQFPKNQQKTQCIRKCDAVDWENF
jgi:hypothetical protein